MTLKLTMYTHVLPTFLTAVTKESQRFFLFKKVVDRSQKVRYPSSSVLMNDAEIHTSDLENQFVTVTKKVFSCTLWILRKMNFLITSEWPDVKLQSYLSSSIYNFWFLQVSSLETNKKQDAVTAHDRCVWLQFYIRALKTKIGYPALFEFLRWI